MLEIPSCPEEITNCIKVAEEGTVKIREFTLENVIVSNCELCRLALIFIKGAISSGLVSPCGDFSSRPVDHAQTARRF